MKKLNTFYDKLQRVRENLDDLIEQLEQTRDAIEEKALDKDRDMTDNEQERYDQFEQEISDIYDCIDTIEQAQGYIVDYCD